MIGVICNKSESEIVKEFFQLFKTPWEFYDENRSYDVILSTQNVIKEVNAKLLVIYGSKKMLFDCEEEITIRYQYRKRILEFGDFEIPIYGNLSTFDVVGQPIIRLKKNSEVAGIKIQRPKRQTLRIGFDLFQEINFLLSSGQPPEYAHIPTLEMHITMLRNFILKSGIPLIEIPPVPAGYVFAACLTHDVDFVGIRNHKFDNTMFGFIYRALLGSFIGFLNRRTSWNKLLKNWKAVLSLPCVYVGLVRDFFNQFDRYVKIEKNIGSTYFMIPFKNRDGLASSGLIARGRSVQYDIVDIKQEVKKLVSNGCEVGLHGIDAWQDAEKGCEELERISQVTGDSNIGVRMHWLYYCNRSPQIMENSGFSYDSTFGYNDAVGYRGGTTQVFRPLGVQRLMELPLHIQDTALFYSSRMGLPETKALDIINKLFNDATKHGGVLTINWHQRSIGPERFWDIFYINMLDELKKLNVWFGTAGEIVEWFKKRRQIIFKDVQRNGQKMRILFTNNKKGFIPPMIIRMYQPEIRKSRVSFLSEYQKNYTDTIWDSEQVYEVSM